MSSELPRHISSWSDVVDWINHLQERITETKASILPEWRIDNIQDRLDMLTFRWVEGDLAGVLLNEGDKEGPEHSMRWSDFRAYLHEAARAYGLEVVNPERLVKTLEFMPTYYRGAIYSERRGGGFRVLTDLHPVEKGASE